LGLAGIIRSASLFAVVVLAVILVASLFSPVVAIGGIEVVKVTTNGDVTTRFVFDVSGPVSNGFDLAGGESAFTTTATSGEYTVREVVPSGWVASVNCEGFIFVGREPSTFEYIPGGVIITFVAPDNVVCTFTNSRAPAVGGVVIPANTLAVLGPWLAVIGLVACVGTAVVIVKKRRS
jgi:hypothetical protein